MIIKDQETKNMFYMFIAKDPDPDSDEFPEDEFFWDIVGEAPDRDAPLTATELQTIRNTEKDARRYLENRQGVNSPAKEDADH
ncbi:MAG: hypothetical protein GY940_44500 [bacterium]|nr:hypothetical protein [bacterium]